MQISRIVLVPFEANRLVHSAIALRNPMFELGDDSQVLGRFAYAIPSARDEFAKYRDGRKTFAAERYGGAGMLRHGGGVRCGLDGDYLVKGIGRNLLAGADVPVAESNGCLFLRSAIAEAILGELCHHALPFGAVRTAAVISTGTQSRHGEMIVRNGLVVRPAVLRPGHFVRSVYFRPLPETKGQIVSDAVRVREAIQFLPDAVPRPGAVSLEDWRHVESIDRLHLGLAEMASRFAEQTAAAEAKRIVHGAISASNVAIDGRWLDFETLSALPGYGNVQGSPSYYWEAPTDFQRILLDICYYIAKYYPISDKSKLPLGNELATVFASHHHEAVLRRFLLLAGFPLQLLKPHMHRPETRLLAEQLLGLAHSGYKKVYKDFTNEDETFGDFDLGRILVVLATYFQADECDIRLIPLIPDARLRAGIMSAYKSFAGLMYAEAETQGIERIMLRRLSVLNATKAARFPKLFSKKYLLQEIFRLDKEYLEIEEFRYRSEMLFLQLSDQASFVYQDPEDFCSRIWKYGGTTIDFDARNNVWLVGTHGENFVFPWQAIGSNYQTSHAMSEMRGYWGEELWLALA